MVRKKREMSRDKIKLMEREQITRELVWNDSKLSDDLLNQALGNYCNAVDKDDLDSETREELQIIYGEQRDGLINMCRSI